MVKIVLTMQRVQSLVRELISHMLCGSAKKWEKKKKLKKKGNKCFFNKEGNFDTCSSTTWPTRLLDTDGDLLLGHLLARKSEQAVCYY